MDQPLPPELTLTPERYGPVISGLLDPQRLPALGPGSPHPAAAPLRNLQPKDLFPGSAPLTDRSMATCCLAGLWLWLDHLDESHTLSQSIETRHGSHWHAIMHRREGDFGNSKYWYRRVNSLEFFSTLGQWTATLLDAHPDHRSRHRPLTPSGHWDPFRFVDWCQEVTGTDSPEENLCRLIARAEWIALFDDCFQKAK